MTRPHPPATVLDMGVPRFVPDEELAMWALETFVADSSPLANPDHQHLAFAEIGALWTNVPNTRGGRVIVGTAQLGQPVAMGKWARARVEAQLYEWFGGVPDFLLTFYAPYAAECPDAEFCALVEHELYHCGQERDAFGAPKFRDSGLPKFAMRGHDVEQFHGIVRRYGADAAGVRELVAAARHAPEVAPASIAQACGTCLARAA